MSLEVIQNGLSHINKQSMGFGTLICHQCNLCYFTTNNGWKGWSILWPKRIIRRLDDFKTKIMVTSSKKNGSKWGLRVDKIEIEAQDTFFRRYRSPKRRRYLLLWWKKLKHLCLKAAYVSIPLDPRFLEEIRAASAKDSFVLDIKQRPSYAFEDPSKFKFKKNLLYFEDKLVYPDKQFKILHTQIDNCAFESCKIFNTFQLLDFLDSTRH